MNAKIYLEYTKHKDGEMYCLADVTEGGDIQNSGGYMIAGKKIRWPAGGQRARDAIVKSQSIPRKGL